MQERYLSSWQIQLSANKALVIFTVITVLALSYGGILYLRFQAQEYLEGALACLKKAQALPQDEIVKKSLFYQEAMHSLQSSIGLNPLDGRPYFEYGQIIYGLCEDSNLLSSLDSVAMGFKGEPDEFYNLSRAYYTSAIMREPTNAIYHQRLGSLFDKMGSPDEAEREFKKTVKLDGQNVSIHVYLAQYFLSIGKDAEFNAHLNKVIGFFDVSLRGGGTIGGLVHDFIKKIGREDLLK